MVWLVPVLAERDPQRLGLARWSHVLAQRAHGNDLMFTLRQVLVDARTYETDRATPSDGKYKQAWRDHLWRCSPGTRRVSARRGWEG